MHATASTATASRRDVDSGDTSVPRKVLRFYPATVAILSHVPAGRSAARKLFEVALEKQKKMLTRQDVAEARLDAAELTALADVLAQLKSDDVQQRRAWGNPIARALGKEPSPQTLDKSRDSFERLIEKQAKYKVTSAPPPDLAKTDSDNEHLLSSEAVVAGEPRRLNLWKSVTKTARGVWHSILWLIGLRSDKIQR